MCQSQLRATSVSPSWGSNNPAKKRLFSIRSLFLKFQLIKAIHYENGDTLNFHDTRKGTFFFFFNTPLFCQRELKALQTKWKEKSPQVHWDLCVSGKEQNSGQFQRDLNFSIKIPPGREAMSFLRSSKCLPIYL